MNAGQLAALIAAGFFAVGVCAAVYVLARLARLISAATAAVTAYTGSADELVRRAQAVVDRADQQLSRTGVISDSVDQVTASMSELSEQVAAVTGTARLIAVGLGAPVLRLAAASHGIRHAMTIRRAGGRAQASQQLRQVPPAAAAPTRVTAPTLAQPAALDSAYSLAQASPLVRTRRRAAAGRPGKRASLAPDRAQP